MTLEPTGGAGAAAALTLTICSTENTLAIPRPANAADTDGKVCVVPSVPASVRELEIAGVLFCSIATRSSLATVMNTWAFPDRAMGASALVDFSTERVSVGTGNVQGNGKSGAEVGYKLNLSGDGNVVLFESESSNFWPGTFGTVTYWHDRTTGVTEPLAFLDPGFGGGFVFGDLLEAHGNLFDTFAIERKAVDRGIGEAVTGGGGQVARVGVDDSLALRAQQVG